MSTGHPECPCKDAGLSTCHPFPCPESWASDSSWTNGEGANWATCLAAQHENGIMPHPPDYGSGCKVHPEPGHADCWDLRNDVPLPSAARASWCDSPWCYVDACNCNVEATASAYFEGSSFVYSYATCGSQDEFAATVAQTPGGAACIESAPCASNDPNNDPNTSNALGAGFEPFDNGTAWAGLYERFDDGISGAGHAGPGLMIAMCLVSFVMRRDVLPM